MQSCRQPMCRRVGPLPRAACLQPAVPCMESSCVFLKLFKYMSTSFPAVAGVELPPHSPQKPA